VGASGACELICDTLAKHPSSVRLQIWCCSLVMSLSQLEKADPLGRPLHIWK
jgi:hypothetical protein